MKDSDDLSTALDRDHAGIVDLLAELRRALRDPGVALDALRSRFDAFSGRLERHLGWEEEIIFPAVAARGGVPAIDRRIRDEHEEMRRFRGIAAKLLRSETCSPALLARVAEILDAFQCVLVDHHDTEERIYHPVVRSYLTAEEREKILSRIREDGQRCRGRGSPRA